MLLILKGKQDVHFLALIESEKRVCTLTMLEIVQSYQALRRFDVMLKYKDQISRKSLKSLTKFKFPADSPHALTGGMGADTIPLEPGRR